jgi:hypothetical protein
MLHRNGVVAVEENISGQKLHGRQRTWHRNGRLATEDFYRDGRLHGLVRQWNEKGRLLGSFRMENGTGTQRSWHDNGRLNLEFTTVEGEFCGRTRLWLRDGTLISDHIDLFGRHVTPVQYRRAAARDPRLPKLRGKPAKVPARNRALEKHMQHLFVQGLLAKPNRSEARAWLKADRKTARSLGRFKSEQAALKTVEELYQAGALRVIVPGIYRNKRGDQFTDYLLVQLPKAKAERIAIHKIYKKLGSWRLGAIEPDTDIGEEYLIFSMV